jgi:hypothetical protein
MRAMIVIPRARSTRSSRAIVSPTGYGLCWTRCPLVCGGGPIAGS